MNIYIKRKISIFCFFVIICIQGFSQQEILQKKIILPSKEYTAIEVLQQIQQSTGINFSYKTKLLQDDFPHTYKISSAKLYEVLQKITDNKDMDFVVINGVVVIKSKKEIQKIIQKTKSSNPQASIEYIAKEPEVKKTEIQKKVISGKITNTISGELILGAIIFIDSLHIQVTSNEFGYFSCEVPEGIHTLRIIHDFHYPQQLVINTENPQENIFNLIDKKQELQSQKGLLESEKIESETNVVFHSKLFEKPQQSLEFSLTDPLRDLLKIPGIQQINDLSSAFSVRGGTIDQNLVIFDDAPIFNPTHLFGYYSTFIPYSIKDITVYKGDAPAQYGGKLSSVVDIRSKDGNENKFGVFGEFGPIVSTVCIETPIIKKHASIILNLRKSNLGWLLKDDNGNELYGFHDGNLKINFHTTKKHRLYYSLYNGGDVYNKTGFVNGEFGVNWKNTAHSLRWNYIIAPKLFSNVTLYASEYNYYLYVNDDNIEYWNSKIATGGIKSDITYFKDNNNVIRFGFDISGYQFNPGNLKYLKETNLGWDSNVSTGTIGILAVYYSHEKQISEKSKITYGIRMPFSKNSGPSVNYVFNKDYEVTDTLYYSSNQSYNPILKLEPRIIYSYQCNPFLSAKISFTQMTQQIHGISNSETQITSLDVWLPSSFNIKPQIARQVSTGVHYTPNSGKILISSELYLKTMKNQIYYKDHASMLLNPLIEGELRFGRIVTAGFELMIQKNGEKLSGWISYTYAHSQMRIADKVIPTISDRPHDISIGLSYFITKHIIFESQWKYLSGKPITTPTGFYEYQGAMVPIYSHVLNDRLPAYHSMDVTARFILNKNEFAKWKHIVTISLLNVYARKNPINITYNKILEDSKYVVPSDVSANNTYISTMLYSGSIIPTITYAIKFN